MEPLGDEQALAAALSLVDDSLGDVDSSLTLFSPLSSPLGAPQWVDASVFDLGALEDVGAAAGSSPLEIPPAEDAPGPQKARGGPRQPQRAPQTAKKTTKRPYNYNSNRARDEQRKELRALRAEAAGLESKLATLRKLGALRGVDLKGASGGKAGSGGQDPLAEVVWKNIAQHQFRKRLASSLKHDELEAAVKANQSAIQRMKDLLRSQSLQRAARSLAIERSFQLSELAEFELHPGLVDQLLAGVAKCYAEIDSVFRGCTVDVSQAETFSTPEMHTDSEGNLFTRVHGSKVFPFNVEKTGVAAWAQFSESVRPNARFFFTEILQSTEEIVIERFGAELHKDKSKIVIHVRQVKRRFIETDRVVVVWQSKVNPIEFEDQKLKGASFDERGYFIIHRPATLPAGYALLQSCYLISPSTPMRSMPENALARNMAEFVLSWMATTIPAIHQIVEDILMGRGRAMPAVWS